MCDVIKVTVDSASQVQWFVFGSIIINARNVEDIKYSQSEKSITFSLVSGTFHIIHVSDAEKTFQAIQEMLAGKQKENT